MRQQVALTAADWHAEGAGAQMRAGWGAVCFVMANGYPERQVVGIDAIGHMMNRYAAHALGLGFKKWRHSSTHLWGGIVEMVEVCSDLL